MQKYCTPFDLNFMVKKTSNAYVIKEIRRQKSSLVKCMNPLTMIDSFMFIIIFYTIIRKRDIKVLGKILYFEQFDKKRIVPFLITI